MDASFFYDQNIPQINLLLRCPIRILWMTEIMDAWFLGIKTCSWIDLLRLDLSWFQRHWKTKVLWIPTTQKSALTEASKVKSDACFDCEKSSIHNYGHPYIRSNGHMIYVSVWSDFSVVTTQRTWTGEWRQNQFKPIRRRSIRKYQQINHPWIRCSVTRLKEQRVWMTRPSKHGHESTFYRLVCDENNAFGALNFSAIQRRKNNQKRRNIRSIHGHVLIRYS